MTKKQVLTSVLVAGFALSSGGAAFADEVQSQSVQPQTSAATVVSQPAADNSTPTVPDSGQASNSDTQPAGGDVSQPSSSTPSSSDTGSSSSQASQPSEQPSQDNSAPASSDTPSVPDSGQSSQPSLRDQGTTAPSGDNSGASTPESSTPSSSAPSPSEPSNSTPETSTPSSSTDKDKGNQPQAAPDQSTPDVSDSNQGSKPDSQEQPGNQVKDKPADKGNQSSQPANQSNQLTAGLAYDQGQSQVGLTSEVTGQVVQDVTPEAPVTTENGSTIVSVQNGQPIVSQSDGSTQAVDPGSVGATVNSDKTLSVKGDDGKMKTLPNTGDGASSAVMASGLGMVLSAVLLFMQSKFKLFTKKD